MFRNGEISEGKRAPSSVWKHFVYSERRQQSSCTVDRCPSVLPGRKTSHLRKHLEREHPVVYGMLAQRPDRASSRNASESASLPSLAPATDHLRKSFEKKLSSAMDTLLKAAVLEITSAFDTVTVDHQMVIKQKMEEISTLRFQLEKAEKKLRECKEKRYLRKEDSQTAAQTTPEIVVEVPDDWCAPLGCENVVDQTPSTSYAAAERQSNSLCSLSVALWRLPDIKQEVQDDGYHVGSAPSDPSEGPKCQVEDAKDQRKHSSAPKPHHHPHSQTLKGSPKPRPGQPVNAPTRAANERLPHTDKVRTGVTHTQTGRGKKKNISTISIKLEPEPTQEAGEDVYPCKFCSKAFNTEFGRNVHTRTHKRCAACNKTFQFPSFLRVHLKSCISANKASVSTPLPCTDKPLHHRIKREKGSPEEYKKILPNRREQPTRKRTFDKCESVEPGKKRPYFPKREKLFPCSGCDKRFCSIVWLQNHQLKGITCARCVERFCTRDLLQRHISAVHMRKPKEISEPLDAVDGESAAVSSAEKPIDTDAVLSEEKTGDSEALSSQEKPSELGDVPSQETFSSSVDDSQNVFG